MTAATFWMVLLLVVTIVGGGVLALVFTSWKIAIGTVLVGLGVLVIGSALIATRKGNA